MNGSEVQDDVGFDASPLVRVSCQRSELKKNTCNCSKRSTPIFMSVLLVLSIISLEVNSFTPAIIPLTSRNERQRCGALYKLTNSDEHSEGREDEDTNIGGDYGGVSGVMLEDLNWRVEKLRLEEQNKKRFLKARARFLPYDECRRWVQAWGKRWRTAKDWNDWIAMGEKRNAYIPSRPDEYYSSLGQWVSWEHFLLVPPESDDAD